MLKMERVSRKSSLNVSHRISASISMVSGTFLLVNNNYLHLNSFEDKNKNITNPYHALENLSKHNMATIQP